MKKKKRIGLWILLVLVLVLAAFLIWQKKNIEAAINTIRYTPEEISRQIEENQDELIEKIEENPDITVREPTREETEELQNGVISEEELITKLTEGTPDGASEYQRQLSELIAEAYAMQAEYVGALNGMMERARQEYEVMPESEKNKAALIKWAGSYISEASEMEKRCDGRMDDLVSRLLKLIKSRNSDDGIVDQVVETYATEKSLKKSWYLSQIQERGLMK